MLDNEIGQAGDRPIVFGVAGLVVEDRNADDDAGLPTLGRPATRVAELQPSHATAGTAIVADVATGAMSLNRAERLDESRILAAVAERVDLREA